MLGRILMNNEPKVSLILVNYNNHKDTVECVKSLLKIDYRNFDVIVVDNASTENISTIDDTFLRDSTYLIKSSVNNGFSAGNNIGIEYAKKNLHPNYILLLNNDTVVKQDFLLKLVDCAIRYEDNALISGKIYYYNKNNILWYAGGYYNAESGFSGHYGYKKEDDGRYDEEKDVTFITGCLMLIPIKILEKVGLLDECYFLYSEDTDYCCRVMNFGYKMLYCPESVIYHKVSATTGDKSEFQQYYMLRNYLYMISKYSTHKFIAHLKRLNNIRILIINKEIGIMTVIKAYFSFFTNKKGK